MLYNTIITALKERIILFFTIIKNALSNTSLKKYEIKGVPTRENIEIIRCILGALFVVLLGCRSERSKACY